MTSGIYQAALLSLFLRNFSSSKQDHSSLQVRCIHHKSLYSPFLSHVTGLSLCSSALSLRCCHSVATSLGPLSHCLVPVTARPLIGQFPPTRSLIGGGSGDTCVFTVTPAHRPPPLVTLSQLSVATAAVSLPAQVSSGESDSE